MRIIALRVCRWLLLALWGACLFAPAAAWAADDAGDEKDDPPPADAPTVDQLKQQIAELERRLAELEKKSAAANEPPAHIKQLDWEADRDGVALGNQVYLTFHGEFRGRALIEANTRNAYTNFGGERVYAYDPRSTFENDYGWWDQRLQVRTVFNFGSTADLIIKLQLGDIVWGSKAPVMGGTGDAKFDQVTLFFRELYTRIDLSPIPAYLVFGRMPVELGNRLIMGNEHDGAYTYFGPKFLKIGFGAVRQYEGENYEMKLKWNDDEDTFFAWLHGFPAERQKLSAFGWCSDWKVTQYPNRPDPTSALYLLPEFSQAKYASQESQQWNVGGNWVGGFGPVTINAEYDHQFGQILAGGDDPAASNIDFKGFAALVKTDWHVTNLDRLALTIGYGSGDDPETTDYEGFFAPDNDFGIKEESMSESIDRGYFSVYEHLAPGAGVPGRLRDGLGTGGIENTVFANLGADIGRQDNHHYYVSWGYLRAARPNPVTNDAEIGWEMDARVDYLFNNNVTFSVYGGHLFMTGEYFRKHAHDAAQLYFEWKLAW
jgi:hypothetical protein